MKKIKFIFLFLFLIMNMSCGSSPSSHSLDDSFKPMANVYRNDLDFPKIKAIVNPSGVIWDPYILSRDQQDEDSNQLKQNILFNKPQVFSAVLIENKSGQSQLIRVFLDGSIKNKYEEWNQIIFGDRPLIRPVMSETRLNAPVTMEVVQWQKNRPFSKGTEVAMVGQANAKVFEVTASSQFGPRSGLMVLLLTQYDFRPPASDFQPVAELVANYRVSHIELQGLFKISSAPQGMPEIYYGPDSNWRDITPPGPLSLVIGSSN